MSTEFAYDVFLTYSSHDRAKATRIAKMLRDMGLRVWFDDWEIRPGDAIPLQIEKGIQNSRTLVLLLSNAALQSDWVSLERTSALFRDPTNTRRRIVPVLLDDAEIPDLLRVYRYVDARRLNTTSLQSLLDACRSGTEGRLEQATNAFAILRHKPPTTPSQLYAEFCETCAQTLGADVCTLWLIDDARQTLSAAGAFGIQGTEAVTKFAAYAIGEGLTGSVAKSGEPLLIASQEELRGHPGYLGKWDQHIWGGKGATSSFGSLCAVPLKSGDEIHGVLKAERTGGKPPFTQQDLQVLADTARWFLILTAIGPKSNSAELIIELELPADTSDQDVIAEAEQLSVLADDLHRELGGHGLKIEQIEILEDTLIPEGVS